MSVVGLKPVPKGIPNENQMLQSVGSLFSTSARSIFPMDGTCEGRQQKSKINYIVWDQTRCALIRNEPLLVIVCTHIGSKMFGEYILRTVHPSFTKQASLKLFWITYMEIIFDFYCRASHLWALFWTSHGMCRKISYKSVVMAVEIRPACNVQEIFLHSSKCQPHKDCLYNGSLQLMHSSSQETQQLTGYTHDRIHQPLHLQDSCKDQSQAISQVFTHKIVQPALIYTHQSSGPHHCCGPACASSRM